MSILKAISLVAGKSISVPFSQQKSLNFSFPANFGVKICQPADTLLELTHTKQAWKCRCRAISTPSVVGEGKWVDGCGSRAIDTRWGRGGVCGGDAHTLIQNLTSEQVQTTGVTQIPAYG